MLIMCAHAPLEYTPIGNYKHLSMFKPAFVRTNMQTHLQLCTGSQCAHKSQTIVSANIHVYICTHANNGNKHVKLCLAHL